MNSLKLLRLGSAGLAIGLLAAGCGSSSGGNSSSDGAKGPIKVGIFATLTASAANAFVEPWSVDGLKAYAKAINSKGGVNGRQLQVVVCDNGGDPNKDAACARKAVSDKWVAVVGGFDPYASNQTLPVLEAASIPYVGFLQVSPVEYMSKVTFPIEAGVIGGASGSAAQMVDDKCQSPAFIGATDSGNKATADQVAAIFKKAGLGYKGVIDFPTGTTDVGPVVAAALNAKPDCLMFNGAGNDAAKIFAGVRKAGSSAKLYAAAGVLTPDAIGALGKNAEGIRGASTAPLSNNPDPAMKTLLTDLKASDPKAFANEFTINAYFAFKVVADALKGGSEASSSALLATLSKASAVDAGVFGTLDFTKVRNSKVYARLFNPKVWYSEIKQGQWQGATADAPASDIEQYLP